MVRPPRFRARRRFSMRRILRALLPWLGLAVILAASALWLRMEESPAQWQRIDARFGLCGERGGRHCVIDGDTVAIGAGAQVRRIRLTGFDAPELDGACDAEREAAQRARTALRDWLNAGPFEWDWGSEPPRDQYGRELRQAQRTRDDGNTASLADHMVEADLAAPSGWGTFPRDWCE